jgi:ABC-2 type transport system ATP-binding protein
MTVLVEAAGLRKTFGPIVAVSGISLSVKKGEVLGFLGPNGAGKSTTMRLLAGFLAPISGSAAIGGHDVARDRQAAQACLGYLPEAAAGFPDLTVREFLTFCAEARGRRGRAARDAITAAAERIVLGPALDRKMKELSKGWRQRAWLAQAILHDPPALILDEPTDGLDPNQKRVVRDYVRSVMPTKAVLLSTHILEEAEEVCTRVIVVREGRIVADDRPANLADARGRLAGTFERLTAGVSGGAPPPR